MLDRAGRHHRPPELRPPRQRAARPGAAPCTGGVHRGGGPALLLPPRRRLAQRGPRPGPQRHPGGRERGVQHDHHAGRAQRLRAPPRAGAHPPPQADRDLPRRPARALAHQAADPRALPQRHLPRQRRLRRRGREPRPVRQERGPPHASPRAPRSPRWRAARRTMRRGGIPSARWPGATSCSPSWRASTT